MNIRDVKEEIKNTVRAYLQRDELGEYRIPQKRQRPILMMGPPGIGKTAIMEQIARECHIGLVAYTITHHTRQSAVGLPVIREKQFGDRKYQVTEYTMSEIIGAVYDRMESSGLQEGILFIDEINCVSETLAPTMLQFLQAKTFGNHRLPEGWLIVAAGNPPEYNKAGREFDIVTLDRVKKLTVEADFEIWKDYAYRQQIHPAILSYLELKKECFYQIKTTVDGMEFVTARGWEDLSELLVVYEELGVAVTAEIVEAYLQCRQIAVDFAGYYELFQRYQQEYPIEQILNGEISSVPQRLKEAAFDERLSFIGLLAGRLEQDFAEIREKEMMLEAVYGVLKEWRNAIEQMRGGEQSLLKRLTDKFSERSRKDRQNGLLEEEQEKSSLQAERKLQSLYRETKKAGCHTEKEAFAVVKELFEKETAQQDKKIQEVGQRLTNAFLFMEKAFGEGQEMVIFVTQLTRNYYSMQFISEFGNEKYYQYNQSLLLRERSQIQEKIRYMLERV